MIPFSIVFILLYIALTVTGAKCPEEKKKLYFRIELILAAAGLVFGLITVLTFGLFPFRKRPEPEFLSWAKDNFFHFSRVTWIMCAVMLFFILLPILVSIVEKRPASGYPVILRYVAPVICSAILLGAAMLCAAVVKNEVINFVPEIAALTACQSLLLRSAYALGAVADRTGNIEKTDRASGSERKGKK